MRSSLFLAATALLVAPLLTEMAGFEGPRVSAQTEAPADPAPPTRRPPPRPQPKPAPKSAPKPTSPPVAAQPAPAPAATPAPADQNPAAEPQPVLHARGAGVNTCAQAIAGASRQTIDTQHTAVSTWYNGAGDAHMFQSIVGLGYPSNVAPRAAAVLVAAPRPNGCESTTVQVYPTARSCAAVQQDILKSGRAIANLSGSLLFESQAGLRNLLMPTAGDGCVMVVVGTNFAADAPAPPAAPAPDPGPQAPPAVPPPTGAAPPPRAK